MRRAGSSLALRLSAGAAVLITIGLVAGTIALSSVFRNTVERAFDSYLSVLLDGLLSVTQVTRDGVISVERDITDPRFEQPLSGWYWQIDEGSRPVLRSRSLFDEALVVRVPPQGARLLYQVEGPSGQRLRVLSRTITFPESDQIFVYSVAGDIGEMEDEIGQFNTIVAGSLGALGLFLLLAVFLQVRFGLQPLRRIPPALAAIRSGRADRLSGVFPAEVEPLAEEINNLLDHNARVVERARTHVGNLAHALKTPIAVLANEAEAGEGPLARKVGEQTALMREQVEHHLARARTAARASALGARTMVRPVVEGLQRTLAAIYRDRGLTIEIAGVGDAAFRGERQDLEEVLGNLMENACKWAASRVRVTIGLEMAGDDAANPSGDDGWLRLVVMVEDDGPGLSPSQRRTAIRRGTRLDEQAPGSGLGLAIVADTVESYSGSIDLGDAALGGLAATVRLPGTRA